MLHVQEKHSTSWDDNLNLGMNPKASLDEPDLPLPPSTEVSACVSVRCVRCVLPFTLYPFLSSLVAVLTSPPQLYTDMAGVLVLSWIGLLVLVGVSRRSLVAC